jgi:hypothetical protein
VEAIVSILDIPPDQLKRIPLETIVLMLRNSVDLDSPGELSIGITMDNLYVKISIERS